MRKHTAFDESSVRVTLPRRCLPFFVAGAVAAVVTLLPTAAGAAPAVGLGTAASFAVLGGSTITNTGPTTVSGDLGLSPGTAVTGFPPGNVVNGTTHVADGVAAQAQADATTAYNTAAGLPATGNVTADLAGQTLVPGVYSGPTLSLNGTLTLDGGGDPAAVFVFRAGSTLITGVGSTVSLVNGTSPCNVFWQVGSSATLGTTSVFAGTLVALTSITATSGASVSGRLIARNGAVTLDTNTVTRPLCAAAAAAPSPTATATTSPSPAAAAPVATATPSAGAPGPSTAATPAATAGPSASASPSASTGPRPPAPTASPSTPALPSELPLPPLPSPVPAPRAPTGVSAGTAGVPVAPAPAPGRVQGPTVPQGPNAPELPATGASVDAAALAGLLALVLGGLLVLAARPPVRGAHERCRAARI